MRHAKLRGAIREKFGTQESFAREMGIHPTTLSTKLRGVTDFTLPEVGQACRLLGIPAERMHEYFFDL